MIEITVYGLPAPQGSKRHVGGGRMIESSKKVKPWREAVKRAALEEIRKRDGWAPMDGPLWVDIVFWMPRPKSISKKRRFPDRTPDLSKLIRSTEDALTDAGVWVDDARVVSCAAKKVYCGGVLPNALQVPGAVIKVVREF